MLKKIESRKKASIICVLEIAMLLLICVVHSIKAGHYSDFIPYNGTFQNFNPVRRFLAGQIPYRDFQDYLGIGHLYFGSFVTKLYGGNYRASLQAFSFLSFLGLAMITLMITVAIFRKKKIAIAVTNLFLIVFLVEPLFYKNFLAGTDEILQALESALTTGNSARFLRGMILPIACWLFYFGYKLYKSKIEKYLQGKNGKEYFFCLGSGIVAGISFVWSNDYGISCWLCILLMTFWISICRERNIVKAMKAVLISTLISLVTLFVTVEIVTLGHFTRWLSFTFGTGGYQQWYYNSVHYYYIFDVDVSFLMLLQAVLVIIYFLLLFIYRGSMWSIKRYGILAFANMVCYCAINEYRLLSGGDAKEVALSVLFVNIIVELGYLLFKVFYRAKGEIKQIKLTTTLILSSLILGLVWCVSTARDEVAFTLVSKKEGVYVKQLGGNLTVLGPDLLSAEEFLHGDEFWATYASGQEVVNGTYQPSGTDYIIHVLGDKNREEYLHKFQETTAKYAVTLKNSSADWASWAERANWFFYRELYKNWHPVYANRYEVYWERNDGVLENKLTSGYKVEVVDIDDQTKKITVKCDGNVNGMEDVYIDYEVKKKSNILSKFLTKMDLYVVNSGDFYAAARDYESNYLRRKSAEYVPVRVVNGYGEITLTSKPENSTYLILNSAKSDSLYTVSTDYLEIWGVEKEGNTLVLRDFEKMPNRMETLKKVKVGGKTYTVSSVSENDYGIRVTLNEPIEDTIKTGNVLQVLR